MESTQICIVNENSSGKLDECLVELADAGKISQTSGGSLEGVNKQSLRSD